jgi:hypothetical protein
MLLWLSLQSLAAVGLETPLRSSANSKRLLIESSSLVLVGPVPQATTCAQRQRTPRPCKDTHGTNARRERAYEEEDESFEAFSFCRLLPCSPLKCGASGGEAFSLLFGGLIESFEHLGSASLRC